MKNMVLQPLRYEKGRLIMGKNQKMPAGISKKVLKSGRVVYPAVAFDGYTEDGKKRRYYKQFDTVEEAVIWRQKMALNTNARQVIAYAKLPVWQAFKIHYQTFLEPKLASATRESYRSNIVRLKRTMPNILVGKVTRTTIQMMFTKWAKEGFAKASQLKIKHRLHRFFEDMVAEGIVDRNPVVSISIEGNQSAAKGSKFLEDSDYVRLIKYLEQKELTIRSGLYDTWLLVALQTGARPGEITALSWSDLSIDKDESTMTIRHSYSDSGDGIKVPKTPTSIRTLVIPKRLASQLRKWRAYTRTLQMASGQRSDYVFMRTDGAFPNNTMINRWLNRELAAIKVPKEKRITAHKLRHSWATYQMNQGSSIAFISKHLGHANIRVTEEVYLHTTNTEYASQAEQAIQMLDVL